VAARDGGAVEWRADSDSQMERRAGRDSGGGGGPDAAVPEAAAKGNTLFTLGFSLLADHGSLLHEASVGKAGGRRQRRWRRPRCGSC